MQVPENPSHSPSAASSKQKRLGGYLVEAGLLTPAQVDVALNDQKLTGMRFGEVLAARGWVKQQTIEYLMRKVVLPEQTAVGKGQPQRAGSQLRKQMEPPSPATNARPATASNHLYRDSAAAPRRDFPIGPPDTDVSWVG